LTVLKGLPLAYNKDLQEDKEPLFDAMEHLSLSLRMLPPVLDGLIVHRERARAAAGGGYSNATELADYLVNQGIPFRDAHHSAGRLVRAAIRESKPLEDLTVAQMQEVEPRIQSDVYVALTVDRAIAKRDVRGGLHHFKLQDLLQPLAVRSNHPARKSRLSERIAMQKFAKLT
jgi:argininosuccinate lyase